MELLHPEKAHWRGKKHKPESIVKMRGHIPWNKGMKMPEEYCKKLSELKKGDKHPNWKGGISPVNKRIYASREYKMWRKAVFERDCYSCQFCGVKGVYVEADHIKPFSRFPELRFEISNGRTLCKPCHEKTPTYKGKLNKGSKYKKHESDPSTGHNSG